MPLPVIEPGWCSTEITCPPKQRYTTIVDYNTHIQYINDNNLCLLGIARDVIIKSGFSGISSLTKPTVQEAYDYINSNSGGVFDDSLYGYSVAFVNKGIASIETGLNSYGDPGEDCYYLSTGDIVESSPGSQWWLCTVFSMGDVYFYGTSTEECPTNSTLINGECVANTGYVWDPVTLTFVATCDKSLCLYLPQSTLNPICKGKYSGTLSLEPNTDQGCETYSETTIYLNYRERYTDGLPSDAQKFIYDAPRLLTIDNQSGTAQFEILDIDANGRCGEVIVTATSSNPRYYQCQNLVLEICCTDEEAQARNSCCPNLFDDKFKIWKDCGGFAEPQYVGNVLKDGTILED